MGYVKTTLAYGISFSEEDWDKKIYPKLKEYFMKNCEDVQDEENRENLSDDDIRYMMREYYSRLKFLCNYGYYHSEVTIGFKLLEEDSDIRTGQNFNFEFPNITDDRIERAINEEILNT